MKDKKYFIDLISKHCSGMYNSDLLITSNGLEELAETLSNQVEKPVGVPKPNTTCENCGHWRSENLECRKDIIWLNKDKNVFFNISDLKTGINFYCSNHTQFEQREA